MVNNGLNLTISKVLFLCLIKNYLINKQKKKKPISLIHRAKIKSNQQILFDTSIPKRYAIPTLYF